MNMRRPGSASDYPAAFGRVRHALPGQRLRWLEEARQAAIARFSDRGFPTEHDEEWRHTSLAALADCRFNVLPAPCPSYLADQVAAHALPGAHLLAFVNGQLEPELCRPGRLPPGVLVYSLAYALERHAPRLEPLLQDGRAGSAFADLNFAFMTDGAWIRVPAGVAVDIPIQLLFLAGEGNPAIQPRTLVSLGADSSAILLEQHVAATEQSYFTNAVTDIALAPGARLTHCKWQQEGRHAFHIAAVNAELGAKSVFHSISLAAGARLARVDIAVSLGAEGAVCELDGLYFVGGHQHIDHHTRIDHQQPDGGSRQLYKGVLDGLAHAVFDGRLIIHPEARDSEAAQSSHHLLLSRHAEVDATPQLEVRADHASCSHAATVGQLPADSGIDRRAQVQAFADEVLERLPLPVLRQRIGAQLARHFFAPAFASRH